MSNEDIELENRLWEIAGILRGNMDPLEYKNYILGFIFYKFLSERLEVELNDFLQSYDKRFTDELDEKYENASREYALKVLGYYITPNYLFKSIIKKAHSEKDNFILNDLKNALNCISNSSQGQKSQDSFINLFEDVDLRSSKLGDLESEKDNLIKEVLFKLDDITFDYDSDILGNAYEFLIGQFASEAGKKAGEFYTPKEVSEVLANIVTLNTDKLLDVYDPTCGSGSLLIRVAKKIDVSTIYGQELNKTTYNLARMNMLLHKLNYDEFNIQHGNSIEKPKINKDKKFEAIVANPPFSAKWSSDQKFLDDLRFSAYGKLAPKSKADYTFVQHMIYHLSEDGTMAIVLPHGVLFRGAAEETIRKYLIKDKNYLDAVIGLPAKLFYGTSIPTIVLIFKKCRKDDQTILFIDASNGFEKGKKQNKLRQEDIDKIITTYKERDEIDKYSHNATLEEIKENEYNLNIPRYVDTFEEEEPIDIDEVCDEIQEINKEMEEVDTEITKYCEELDIRTPF